jgi:glucuronosyltransferase
LSTSFNGAYGAKILAFFSAAVPSHMALKSALLRELASRGHHVTAVSPFPEKVPISNYTDIVVQSQAFGKFGKKIT